MARWEDLFFGRTVYEEGEAYIRFQYRFLYALTLCGFGFTVVFLASVHGGAIEFDPVFLRMHWFFLISTLVMSFILRFYQKWMFSVAWYYWALALVNYSVDFLYNELDELRIIWFCLNLPAVYLLLGPRVGAVTAVMSMVFIVVANPYLDHPYSLTALITVLVGIAYISVFFHAFRARSISFHYALVEANRALNELATRDSLTGLLNSRTYGALGERLIRAGQRAGRPCCVLFVDLDHFKRINDQYGHEAGDDVLKAVAATLQGVVRSSDLVGRIGGEEFSLLLPDTDLERGVDVGEKLRRAIEARRIATGGMVLGVTASIGVAESRDPGQNLAQIQKEADQAMYAAKREGRNRVTALALQKDGVQRLAG